MEDVSLFLIFRLDEQRYALPLSVVDEVVRRVEITALIKATPIVAGVDHYHSGSFPEYESCGRRCRE
jgi:chemotaxis signal transduction protein